MDEGCGGREGTVTVFKNQSCERGGNYKLQGLANGIRSVRIYPKSKGELERDHIAELREKSMIG